MTNEEIAPMRETFPTLQLFHEKARSVKSPASGLQTATLACRPTR